MEDLNKTQIVLLCLLVSFVTSIGTGIITVSLLQEAPQSVTQTINRVVERTVEKVVPQTVSGPATKEVTVVVKEEDLVIDAINKNSKSIARIAQNGFSGNTFVGIGLVVTSDGTIVSDKKNFAQGASYSATFFDNKTFPLKITASAEKNDSVLLTVVKDNQSEPYTFYPAITANSDTVQLGQTVIALGGKENNAVSVGRVTGLLGDTSNPVTTTSSATSTKQIAVIETDAPPKENISGTLLINLNGEVVGLYLPNPNESSNRYVAVQVLKRANGNFFELPKKNSP